MNTITEEIAFIAIRARKEGETDDQALVFGSALVPDSVLDKWKNIDDQARNQLKKIATRSPDNKKEFWLARQYSLEELQKKLKEPTPVTLWDSIFEQNSFPSSKDLEEKKYFPFSPEPERPYQVEIKDDGVGGPASNVEHQYFVNLRRILFYNTLSPSQEVFLNAPTANPNLAETNSPRSRVFFISHKIKDAAGKAVKNPFLEHCHIHVFVRLIANAHSDNAMGGTNPAGIIIASRKTLGSGLFLGYFEFQVGKLCEFAAKLPQRKSLCDALNGVLGININSPLTPKNIGTAKDSLINAITSQYPMASDKLGDFLGVVKLKMGKDYPLEIGESFFKDNSMGFDEITFKVTTGEKESRSTILKKTPELISFFDSQNQLEELFGSNNGTHTGSGRPPHTKGEIGAPAFEALGLTLDRKANLSHGFGLRKNKHNKLLLRFETVHHLKKNTQLPGGVPVDFPKTMEHAILTQEQPNIWDDLLSVPSSLEWIVALSGFDQHLTPYGAFPKEDSFAEFVKGWNSEVVSPILNALTLIKAGLNLSTLPKLNETQLKQPLNWALFGTLTDADPGNRHIDDPPAESRVSGRFYHYMPTLPSLALQEYKNTEIDWPKFECIFEAFRDHEGESLIIQGRLEAPDRNLPEDPNTNLNIDNDPFQPGELVTRDATLGIRFQIKPIGESASKNIRLGSYDFEIAQAPVHGEPVNALFDVQFVREIDNKTTIPIPRLEFRSRITAVSARQVAEDLPQRDIGDIGDAVRAMPLVAPPQNADRAIVIPLSKSNLQDDRYYVLVTHERVGELWSHSFNLELEAHIIDIASASLPVTNSAASVSQPDWTEVKPDDLYIGREPFQVAAAQNIDLFSKVDAGGDSIVAVWTSENDSGRWELKIPSQRVTLFLPPQAVGESMEKSNVQGVDLDEGKRADFRFSPVTLVEIDPSNLDTIFCEPALNLHRLLGWQGGIRSGVGLYTANFELLYGMNIDFAPKNVVSSEAPVRLAERKALDGRTAPLLTAPDQGTVYEQRWTKIRSALASRLAVLELSTPFSSEQRRFTDGVTLELRKNADLKHPVPGTPVDKELPFSENGLAGGVTWPFESANIVRNLWNKPKSEAAMLDRISLSALGGYGHQRGEFDGKLTVIETVTAMGRVHRYQLEQIGRIGCLWNRAKHVIVYERSVVPSPQFVNEDVRLGIKQHLHNGRPVLRKVEEFIELLEPINRFDEDDSNACGFMVGAAFRTQKIRVDSSWGKDVRHGGWEVPLWRRDLGESKAHDSNPFPVASLYPKPQIDLLLIASDGKEIACEIAEPEKLRFYSGGSGSDVNKWDSVITVDFPDAAEPTIPNATDHPMPLTEGMLPAAASELAGWNRFTLGLVQNGERISVGFGRVKNSPSTQLSNVCIARAQPQTGTQSSLKYFTNSVADGVQKADLVVDQFEALLINLDPSRIDVAAMPLEAELRRRLGEFNRVKDKLATMVTKAGGDILDQENLTRIGSILGANPCDLIKQEIKRVIDLETEPLHQKIDEVFKRLELEINKAVEILTTLLQNTQLDLEQKKTKALPLLNELEAVIKQLQDEFIAGFDSAILPNLGLIDDVLAIEPAIIAAQQMLERAKNNIGSLIVINSQTVTATLIQIETSAEQARSYITPYCQRYPVLSDVDMTLGDLIKAASLLKSNLPATSNDLKIKLNAFSKDFLEVSLTNIGKKLEEIQSVFAEIKDLKEHLLSAKSTVHTSVDEGVDTALKALEGIEKLIENEASDINTALQNALKTVNTAQAAIKTVLVNAKKKIDGLINKALASVLKTADEFCLKLFEHNDSLKNYMTDFGNKLLMVVGSNNVGLKNLEDTFSKDKDTVQKKWEKLNTEWEKEKQAFEKNRRQAEAALENIRTRVNDYTDKATEIHQKGSNALRLIRAVGKPPATPGLDFNRPEVAFVFAVGKTAGIDMTPVVGRINRGLATVEAAKNAAVAVEDTLNSFGVSLPMRELADEFTPDALKGFDISRIFPDMGGLKLGGLFQDFEFPKMDEGLKKAIKITHQFDAVTRSASLDAVIDLPLKKPAKIFELGPVRFDLKKGSFDASAKVIATLSGQTSHTSKGSIGGDFELEVAGLKIIRFRDTKLEFDDKGNCKFDIKPERVELADALQFLVLILQKVTSDSGFAIEPVKQGDETVGLAAILDTQLPNITAGAFGISNLQFHTSFEIITRPEFEIGVGLSLGSRTRPFILMIAFLAGGGYVLSRTRYIPAKGELTQELAISASAGAAAAFNFGVIEGNVSLLVGIEVAFYWRKGGGQSVAIALYVLANGGIVVLGLLHVDLSLRLEVRYVDNGLSCSGTLVFTVKISCFYKQKVRERVNYQLIGNSATKDNYDEGYM